MVASIKDTRTKPSSARAAEDVEYTGQLKRLIKAVHSKPRKNFTVLEKRKNGISRRARRRRTNRQFRVKGKILTEKFILLQADTKRSRRIVTNEPTELQTVRRT